MIALSYRREDSLPVAGRLYDRLQATFGKQNVFMDFDSIRPGFDFRDQIKQTIERCEVVIVMIGPRWLGEQSDASRRIDDPSDFVRLEIGYALKRSIPIIPVLIDDTSMPKAETLPEDIQGLVFRHALPLDSGLDFHQHADRLISGIAGAANVAPAPGEQLAAAKLEVPKTGPVRSRKKVLFGFATVLLAAAGFAAWFITMRLPEPLREKAKQPAPLVDRSTAAEEKSKPAPANSLPPPAPEPAAAETVKKPIVEVSSVPNGAKVFRNGEMIGTTPIRRDDFSPGDTTLLVVLDGFLPREIKASVGRVDGLKQEVLLLRPARVYRGDIWVREDRGIPARPLAITLDPTLASGTMAQTSKRGDFVVRFTGIWEGTRLHAVTREVVAQPPAVQWTPESFTLNFGRDDARVTYECAAEGKTYTADLAGRSGFGGQSGVTYKGTIRKSGSPSAAAGIPLKIVLGADGKSGTQTQSSKSGDTVVKFAGVWEGDTLRAVTDEVISKPKNIQWKPESFSLRFAEDGQTGSYECISEDETFSAQLSTQ